MLLLLLVQVKQGWNVMSAKAEALGGRPAATAAMLAAAQVAASAAHGVSGGCCKNCSNLCNFCCKNVQQLHWCWVRWSAAANVDGEVQKSIGAGGVARADFESV